MKHSLRFFVLKYSEKRQNILSKLKKAEDLCRFYLQSNPHNVDGIRLLASLASILHIYDESEFLLESCLVFEPENKEVQIEYVDILIKRQKYGPALDFATKIFTKSPEDISLMKLMAVTLQQTDNQLQALDMFKKIIDIEPNNAEIHLSLIHI